MKIRGTFLFGHDVMFLVVVAKWLVEKTGFLRQSSDCLLEMIYNVSSRTLNPNLSLSLSVRQTEDESIDGSVC